MKNTKKWEEKLARRKRAARITAIVLAVLMLVGVITIPLYSMAGI